MTEIAVTPFPMRNAVVTLGTPGDDFAAACSSAALNPAGGTTDFKGLKKTATFTYPLAVTMTLDLDFAQDWSTQQSLSWYLWQHMGENVPFTLEPNDADATLGQTAWAGVVGITPGAVGGGVDTVATATVSLGCVGLPEPTFTAGTPAP